MTTSNWLRIKKLSRNAIIPTKSSMIAAGHDIYALRDGTMPAQRQMLVDIGIAIGLPKGTHSRLAARSGLASKQGRAVGGGVLDANYTEEVKVIFKNHSDIHYEFKADDRIAKPIVERIQTSETITVKERVETECGTKGFGSSDIGPKRLITAEAQIIMMCFLHPDPRNITYYDKEDIHTHPDLTDEITILSSAMIAAVQMPTMDESFLNRIRAAGNAVEAWTERKGELSRLKERQEPLPKNWELKNGLIYFKNRLFIPSDEELLTEIAKG